MTMVAGSAAEWERTAHAALREGRHRAARDAALRAAELKAGDPRTAAGVVFLLAALNLGDALARYVDGLGPSSRLPVPLLMTIANHLSQLGEQERALACLDEVHRADPDFPPGLLARAQVLMYFGRKQESRRDLDHCLRRAPEFAQAHWLRAKLDAGKPSAGSVEQMRGALARPGIGASELAFLWFAMHMALDGLGEHEAAWAALERACQAKRSLLKYAADDSRRLIDALVAMPPGPAADAIPGGKIPVFIVGMHRSGTTLLEQMLDGSPQVRAVGELYDFTSAMRFAADHHCRGVIDTTIVERAGKGGFDFAAVGRHYLESVARRIGTEPFFVDKLPSNFLNIGFICRALPQARILRMVRDPMETCFSNLRELFSDANAYSYDQRELAEYFLQYRRLMAHWHAACPGRILDVSYAALTGDPATEMKRVAAFCGMDYVPAMLDPRNTGRAVATASAVQVRESVARREVPKWAPYEAWLQPLATALGPGCCAATQ